MIADPETAQPTYLTTVEIAGQLRVNRSTVHRWIIGGQLPALRVGRQWRVDLIELQRFLGQEPADELDEVARQLLSHLAASDTRLAEVCGHCGYHKIDPKSSFGWCASCTTDRQIEIDAANEREKARKLRWWDANGNKWREGRRAAAKAAGGKDQPQKSDGDPDGE